MKRFVEGADRGQGALGFGGVEPKATGRPSYHSSCLLKLYIYGYLNRVQSSRRLEREAGRNVEVMWLTRRLSPDHKAIADFRKNNGGAFRQVCARFVALCRAMGLLTQVSVAIDGSKFKAVTLVPGPQAHSERFIEAPDAPSAENSKNSEKQQAPKRAARGRELSPLTRRRFHTTKTQNGHYSVLTKGTMLGQSEE